MSEYQVKGKEGINAERPEDKKGEKFNVIEVEGLKVKTEKKKKAKVLKVCFCFTNKLGFYPVDNRMVMKDLKQRRKE